MTDPLNILETAISDVGQWRWWTSNLPASIQLEFGGTLLLLPPASPGRVTSGLLAIRLREPVIAAFLTAQTAGLPEDWPEAMQRDEYKPFTLEHDRFTLTSFDSAARYVEDAGSSKSIVGSLSNLAQHRGKSLLAFWAGRVGFVGIAESIALFSMQGDVDLESVPELNSKWWSYWREYWDRKDTTNPMPEDYACEVTIPAAEE